MRRPWQRALSVLLSFGLGIGIGECALRATRGNLHAREGTDWITRVEVHHGEKERLIDVSVLDPSLPPRPLRTDPRGYLLPSRRFPNPDATIAFLGGSVTECAALAEDERWPALVSTLLEERGLRVDTLNAGKSGSTAHDAVNILVNHVSLDRPDVAVLMEAASDIGVLRRDPEYRSRSSVPMSASIAGRWFFQTISGWSALLGVVRDSYSAADLPAAAPKAGPVASAPIEPYERRLRLFVAASRALGIVPVLMTQPFASKRTEISPEWTAADGDNRRFNQAIRDAAAENGVALIDLIEHLDRTLPGWNQDTRLLYDGIHTNAAGSRAYAEAIADRIAESLPTWKAEAASLR